MVNSEDDFGLHSMDTGFTDRAPTKDVYGFVGESKIFESPEATVSYLLEEATEYDVSGVDISVMESFFRSDLREYSSEHVDHALSMLEQNSDLEPIEVLGYVRSSYRAEDEPELGTVTDGRDWMDDSGFAGAFRFYDEH